MSSKITIDPSLPLITEPSEGIPKLISTPAELSAYAHKLAGGTGPIGADAERASGYRYGQDPYLIQINRTGAGIGLIDPQALDFDLHEIGQAAGDALWILHAAHQDLPNLHQTGIYPAHLFDTELAARLLNLPHVGLAAIVAQYLGIRLAKEHGAADWSTRPLPADWLAYAALDVEYLSELYTLMSQDLTQAGKLHLAREEFAAELVREPHEDPERWRKLSGINKLANQRQYAIARELWHARDHFAQKHDIAPGRVLPDAAIVAAAKSQVSSKQRLAELKSFRGRESRTQLELWWKAIYAGRTTQNPPSIRRRDRPTPPPKAWMHRRPAAARWFNIVRCDLELLASSLTMPHENVLQPAALKDLCWKVATSTDDLAQLDFNVLEAVLVELGVRPWQRDLCLPILLNAARESVQLSNQLERHA